MMEIDSDDDVLHKLARGGTMDYSAWPLLLCSVVSRIEKIAHTEFPIPVIPPPRTLRLPPTPRFLAPLPSSDPIEPSPDRLRSSPTASGSRTSPSLAKAELERSKGDGDAGQNPPLPSSQDSDTNKENTNPSIAAVFTAAAASSPRVQNVPGGERAAAVVPSTDTNNRQLEDAPSSSPPSSGASPLPVQIQAQLNEITSTLGRGFPDFPPHTIQRLAELVLRPRQHYRSLTGYLHAVDRVVHVTSGANIYPLPPAVPSLSAMTSLANGILGSSSSSSASTSRGGTSLPADWASASTSSINPGSDEALGGALLTPIPWLVRRDSDVDGADAALSPEVGMDGGELGDSEVSSISTSQHLQQQQPQHSRQQQQRLSTESTETIDGPNGMGHIETVSVSVNGIISHRATAAMAAAMARAGSGSGSGSSSSASSSSLATSQHQQQQQQQQGITQGELLREEQQAGVVPVSQLERAGTAPTRPTVLTASDTPRVLAEHASLSESGDSESRLNVGHGGSASAALVEKENRRGEGEAGEDEDEAPHARGPDEIGPADTGPQAPGTNFPLARQGSAPAVVMDDIDVEAAVGRPADPSSAHPSAAIGGAAGTTTPMVCVRGERASTPKREAEEPLAGEDPPSKKVKEDRQPGGAGSDAGESRAGGGSSGAAALPTTTVDSDGDIVIADDVTDASVAAAAAGVNGEAHGKDEEGRGKEGRDEKKEGEERNKQPADAAAATSASSLAVGKDDAGGDGSMVDDDKMME